MPKKVRVEMVFSYKQWYKENKAELSKKRKRRYRQDKDYRTDCRAKALKYYKTHKRKTSPVDRFRIQNVAGDNYVTIGRVAKAIDRSVHTVRLYHAAGLIPMPLFFDRRGWRLYTMSQLGVLRKTFEMLDKGKIAREEARETLSENWG